MKQCVGTVEKVEFTHGGLGNQWTWIDGVRYMTFWDIRTINWKEGDRVQFESEHRLVYSNLPPALQAFNIKKLEG